jgi:hypothetical protein
MKINFLEKITEVFPQVLYYFLERRRSCQTSVIFKINAHFQLRYDRNTRYFAVTPPLRLSICTERYQDFAATPRVKKPMWKLLGILGICGILFSCNSKPNPSVNHGVNPSDTTHFETQALTPEDRVKLANATGKTVHPIEIDVLATQINNATGKLHLYCFWNLESTNSVSTLKAVHSLSTKFDSTKLAITFVNMPGRQTMEAINLFIRENQLTEETLILEKADVSFFSKRINKEFTGVTGLPVVILANKAHKTMQFYNRLMDEKELSAIVQPLL